MTDQKFKILFFRGTEEEFEDIIIVGDGPEPDLIVDLPEKYSDHLYNSLLEITASEKREATPK